ncbi:hypothetical protein ACOMD4_37715 [Streptomyces anulatus]|uniref:hypothetical protein n=1 Tax=Streptomyces anulatus TaxID=1892 RepID=UPI003B7BC9D7
MTETTSSELARITHVETAAERTGTDGIGELADLAPAADEAFAGVLDAAADSVMTSAEDPYDFDDRLHADNLGGAASEIRRAFRWL